jgi:nicotinamide-nucleotide amidase
MDKHTDKLQQLSREVGELLLQQKQLLVTAESCTGGGIATAVTDIAGSSSWFDRAFVTYSNQAKMEMIGVSHVTLEACGAVSQQVVQEMARGALDNANATIAVSVSGIAGPGGGSEEKPVGTVWFGWRYRDQEKQEKCCFDGDRAAVRYQACIHALQGVKEMLIAKMEI